MSRGLAFLVLGILVVLMGVMQYTVQQSTKPPTPTKEQQEAMGKQRKQAQRKEADERRTMMQKMAQMRKSMAADTKKHGLTTPPGQTAPKPSAGMQITDRWFKDRPTGMAGVEQVQKAAAEAKTSAAPVPFQAPPKPTK